MLLSWTAILDNFGLRAGHSSFDAGLNLLERFHNQAVIPSAVEGSCSIAQRFRRGIPQLRFAPLGMTSRKSSFDYRRLKHIAIRCRLQIVSAKSRHRELAWLIRLKKRGLICAGQFLFIDLAL